MIRFKYWYLVLLALWAINSKIVAVSLKQMFDQAVPGGIYDKVIELETGVTYTGGLLIGPVLDPISNILEGEPGVDVRIIGNGAILDLEGEQICISYCSNRLVIEDCIILNGNVRFRGINSSVYQVQPEGSVRYVTFYKPHDFGIRLQGAGQNITLERNIVVDAVDTGFDFIYTSGLSAPLLPTGASYGISIFPGVYGTPVIIDNWSYHSDEEINADSLNHYAAYCEFS